EGRDTVLKNGSGLSGAAVDGDDDVVLRCHLLNLRGLARAFFGEVDPILGYFSFDGDGLPINRKGTSLGGGHRYQSVGRALMEAAPFRQHAKGDGENHLLHVTKLIADLQLEFEFIAAEGKRSLGRE